MTTLRRAEIAAARERDARRALLERMRSHAQAARRHAAGDLADPDAGWSRLYAREAAHVARALRPDLTDADPAPEALEVVALGAPWAGAR